MLQIISIIEDTMVDGPGFRTAIYAAGCKHQCKGCHNPQSWDFKAGRAMTTDQIMQIIKQDPFANVSFSGGDPMYQPEGFAELAQAIRSQTNKTIWCWTGFSFEMLLRMPKQRELLELIDVLVDGPYVEALRDTDLLFRGSRNQRLIDVKASLKAGNVVLYYDPMTMVS
ncbi:MAG: anaerobic ribonucleoside-triphosphate reductase activating protein [Bacteroidaceae bacterium]|nr:anaerobic ribonucleoside-triphosphate reductase activating protein [Bacteroidaceae bacterium]